MPTLARVEFERLVAAIEDRVDLAAIAAQAAREAALGVAQARADYLPVAAVERMLAGESPVRIWREHRNLTARALAEAAGVNAAYLSEIESGRKPGSARALAALARVLHVSVDELLSDDG